MLLLPKVMGPLSSAEAGIAGRHSQVRKGHLLLPWAILHS